MGPPSRAARWRVEWPTWAVVVAVYGGWLATTASYTLLPTWIAAVLGGWFVAWHGSLQHEAVHGHPTGRPRLDALVAGIPLSLYLPFSLYRESHLAHHATPSLTCPHGDPESYLVDREAWDRAGPLRRAFLWGLATLLGRLVLGPPWVVARTLCAEARAAVAGDRTVWRRWVLHALAVTLVLGWVVGICEISVVEYLLAFVYPGLSLTLLRSFAEHRMDEARSARTSVVEASPVFGLLYLHNNLHVVHHDRPGLPWYSIPGVYRRQRDRLNVERFAGYSDVAARFLITPRQHPTGVAAGGRP